jgi:hypothetical protein
VKHNCRMVMKTLQLGKMDTIFLDNCLIFLSTVTLFGYEFLYDYYVWYQPVTNYVGYIFFDRKRNISKQILLHCFLVIDALCVVFFLKRKMQNIFFIN